MVMKPEPWGAALDAVAAGATIIFTTPSGEPFTQALARELSGHEHLVFACGRYEGIDQRVIEHAATLGTVREISLGDYVLNGGEVAALAITEAVVRLLPGFMGNAESLVEESHEDGLLEYPVYTKPASWRGPRGARGAALRRPRPDRPLAPRAGGSAARRSAGPTSSPRPASSAASPTSTYARRCRPTRASSTPSSAPAGSRSWRPTPASRSRRCASRSTTYAAGWGSGP